MQKRSSKPEDANQITARIRTNAPGEITADEPFLDEKQLAHYAAVALGRRGGLIGGKARAEKLSPKRRKAIAKKAAEARWSKQKAQD